MTKDSARKFADVEKVEKKTMMGALKGITLKRNSSSWDSENRISTD